MKSIVIGTFYVFRTREMIDFYKPNNSNILVYKTLNQFHSREEGFKAIRTIIN